MGDVQGMVDPSQVLTTSKVNRAGRTLKRWWRGDAISDEAAERALNVLLEFRAAHRLPLTKATMGLRSVVTTEGCVVEVSQRLKRVPTMVEKLARFPNMALSTMQDVGGCRAVVDTIDEVRRVQRRLSKNRPPLKVSDYIAEPQPSGYRGVHVIVQYDGRTIEAQLRTRVMHDWAIAVERYGGRLQADLKSSVGPAPVLDWLAAVSEAMALEEREETVDATLMARIDRLRSGAVRYLSRGGRRS